GELLRALVEAAGESRLPGRRGQGNRPHRASGRHALQPESAGALPERQGLDGRRVRHADGVPHLRTGDVRRRRAARRLPDGAPVPRPPECPAGGRGHERRRSAHGRPRKLGQCCAGDERPLMPTVHFTNLLIVVAVGFLAPLALGFFPRVRLPSIVLELGIAIGPSVLGWVEPDLAVSILALVGLAFLLFLSGLEIDFERLRGRILRLTSIGFAVSFGIAIVLGLGLKAGGFVKSPLFVAIVLVASSVGVIVPVLKDSGTSTSNFGQLVIAAASIAEFGAIILLSLFFSGSGSTGTAGTLILLGGFGLVVLLVGLAVAGVEHSMSLAQV